MYISSPVFCVCNIGVCVSVLEIIPTAGSDVVIGVLIFTVPLGKATLAVACIFIWKCACKPGLTLLLRAFSAPPNN